MKRAVWLVALAALLLPACRGTDRPEGVVERWLISLNQGKAGEPQKYAPDALSQQVLPNWRKLDPGELDVIEVGKGERFVPPEPVGVGEQRYLVPFLAARLNGSEVRRTAQLLSIRGEPWRIERLLPGMPRLLVPSDGGRRIGGASTGVWLAGTGVAGLLILLSAALMSTVGKRARVDA